MNENIWRVLAQILYYRNDLIEIIKPFFKNLKNENLNDEKFLPFLKRFPIYKLKVLYQNGIITETNFNSLTTNIMNNNMNQDEYQDQLLFKYKSPNITSVSDNLIIEEIISGDKIKELQELIQEKDINTFNTIQMSFHEVEKMKIPLIQYCIMKNAMECFKYLLVNGYDDPNKTMEEQERRDLWIDIKRYKWDCMATAIYYGNMEIVKILEDKGIEKGNNSAHIEAAILSYRNSIVKEIIEEMNSKNIAIDNYLNSAIVASAKNNNIKGIKLLIKYDADINITENIYLNIIIIFLINLI